MKSWKTTAAGAVAAIGIIFTQAGYFMDADPNTTISWEAIMAALGVLGIGYFAKDKSTTGVQ